MKRCPHKIVFLVGLILALLITSCTGPTPEPITATRIVTREVIEVVTVEAIQACTLKGCLNALNIELEGHLPSDFTVTADFESFTEKTRVQAHCTNGRWQGSSDPCRSLQLPQTPENVTVTITWTDATISQSFTPLYEEYQPNGPGCEPVCEIGSVTMIISER